HGRRILRDAARRVASGGEDAATHAGRAGADGRDHARLRYGGARAARGAREWGTNIEAQHRRCTAGGIRRRARQHGGVCEPFGKGGEVRTNRGAALALLVLLAGCGYNTIQTMDEQVNAAESQIKVQLQRRADLIPNLVETVKGFARQESLIFVQVAEARAKLAGAVQSGNLQQMGEANAALTAPLGRLIAIAEAYPQLKSNENFRAL